MDDGIRRQLDRIEGYLTRMTDAANDLQRRHRFIHGSDDYRLIDGLHEMIAACSAENKWIGERLRRAAEGERQEWNRLVDLECRRREEAGELLTLERQRARLDRVRLFTTLQKKELYLRADGRCEICGIDLDSDWQADHKIAHSRGGLTTIENGLALCRPCNARKSAKVLTVDE